jgi:hypothetical protein
VAALACLDKNWHAANDEANFAPRVLRIDSESVDVREVELSKTIQQVPAARPALDECPSCELYRLCALSGCLTQTGWDIKHVCAVDESDQRHAVIASNCIAEVLFRNVSPCQHLLSGKKLTEASYCSVPIEIGFGVSRLADPPTPNRPCVDAHRGGKGSVGYRVEIPRLVQQSKALRKIEDVGHDVLPQGHPIIAIVQQCVQQHAPTSMCMRGHALSYSAEQSKECSRTTARANEITRTPVSSNEAVIGKIFVIARHSI